MSKARLYFIRAINVGGASLPMAELRSIAMTLGATGVQTYIASGNLLCVPPDDADAFERQLERAIKDQFGFFREVISRSRPEVQAALAAYPFNVLNPKFSYITFLQSQPTPAAVARARTFDTGADQWEVIGREMHIRYEDGAGRPQMKDASIMRALAVAGTARNLNTVRKLLSISE